jgi:hypothetical protein
VTDATGRLGPVDDPRALADNILEVWDADREAMGEVAQSNARQYSWDRSMADLFGSLYPKAFRRAWGRSSQATGKLAPVLADA